MSRRLRLLLLLIVIEAALAGLWWTLARFGQQNPDRVTADFQTVLGQAIGMAMGGMLGLGVFLFVIAARADRNAAGRWSIS